MQRKQASQRYAFIFSVLSLGALFISGVMVAAADDSIKFKTTFDKSEYGPDDAINVTFILKNDGGDPVYVNKRFYIGSETAPEDQKDVYFILTSPSGKKLSCTHTYETGYPKSDYFELLEPGKEVKSEYPRNLRGFFVFEEDGTYRAEAVYQNVFGKELGLKVFKDKLIAEPVLFKIVKPAGGDKASGSK